MAINWYVDEGLKTLGNEWLRVHPGAIVFYIGDASHASRDSEHNPEPAGPEPGADYGEVDAGDFMIGKGVTHADLQELADGLVESRDARILYLIWNGRICSSVVVPWVWRTYHGADQHTDHMHLSVNDKFDKNTADWKWEPTVPQNWTMKELPKAKLPAELKYGQEDVAFNGYNVIGRLQAIANHLERSLPAIDTDGVYGANTARKVGKLLQTDGKKITAEQLAGFYGITGY